jgi:protein-S-isoprenylcysteine O-methyltransferase Ste14
MTGHDTDRSRILPPAYFLAALILMVCLNLFVPVARLIRWPVRYLGLIPFAGAGALVGWAAGLFRRAGTTIKPFQSSTVLVVKGPYRLTRNPMYVGMAGILLGTAILLGSLSPFAVAPVFIALIHARFIRAEESDLERTFGAAYTEYTKRVRRWL